VKDPRRTFALVAALSAVCLTVVTAPPAGATTCSFNSTTHVLTAKVSSGSGIDLDHTHVQVVGCASYAAAAVDTVNVTGTAGADLFALSITFPLPAGHTAEGSGISEVEVHIDLAGGTDVLEWHSSAAATHVTTNTFGFDLNGDGDADINPAHVETFRLRTDAGDDSFDASGGIPSGITDVDIEDGAGHDTVTGGPERDTLNPGNGDDAFLGGLGNDVVEVMDLGSTSSFDLGSYRGSGGADTIVFDGPVIADLGAGTAREPSGPVAMTFTGFENLTAGGGNDTLIGNDGPNVLSGATGDVLRGLGGNDTLIGRTAGTTADYGDASGVSVDLVAGTATGDGSDTLAGIEVVLGSPGNDSIQGGSQDDVLAGGAGNDDLRGGDGADELHGGPGGDLLAGDDGPDGLAGGSGDDEIAGGQGSDGWSVVLRSAGAPADEPAKQGAKVDLARGIATDDGHGGRDTISGVEKVFGTPFADRFIGGPADNVLSGGGGNDRYVPGLGADDVAGGRGRDLVSYASAVRAIAADLRAGAATGQGQDRLSGIEVVLGGPRGDALKGTARDERLSGGGGGDTLAGRGGRDSLVGGPGADRLGGGDGTDTCNGGASSHDAAKACELVWRVP
jgi:Ca2+-binding RTX toxin-like protein